MTDPIAVTKVEADFFGEADFVIEIAVRAERGVPIPASDVLRLLEELRRPRPDAPPETPYRTAGQRRALRRLQSALPTPFERVIDVIYEYREHSPASSAGEILRVCLMANHNADDASIVRSMQSKIKEVRLKKLTDAIASVGLDAAERLLGLKKEDE